MSGKTIMTICPTCGEHLGMAHAAEGFDARWWADKAINEHQAESHD